MESTWNEIKFSDDDVVNPEEYTPSGKYNPYSVRPWLLHDHGFALAVVFASCEQDALDEAADNDKLDRYKVDESELADYKEDGLTYLGNASEAFNIECLSIVELPNPKFSFCALFNAHNKKAE